MKENQRYEMSTEDEELQGEGSGREELQGNVNVASKQLCTFKLCGDNIDKCVKRRYMHADKGNLSLHYFHSYAVLDRIDLRSLSDDIPGCLPSPNVIALSLLPSAADDTSLRKNFSVLVSRVLAKYFRFFKFTFDDAVEWHIHHDFSTEMSKKSIVVSLCCCYIITLISGMVFL